MPRIKLIVSYDGTDFCGWQKQKDHAQASELPSIQESIEKTLENIFRHKISLSASGRTDAGVHALAQVAHFDTDRPLPKDLCWAMRSSLPSSVVIKDAFVAPKEFHSTLSAEKKTYRYWIWNRPRPTALLSRFTWWVRAPLNIDQLNTFAKYLISKQDFESFRSQGTPVKHTVREIYAAKWTQRRPGLIQFEVTGSGFLKQMVRNIVGTQVEFALKNQPEERMADVIKAKNRKRAGPAAPAQGLFLYKVYYPKVLDNKCRRI
jgi:tRNA pseudouridine38-40 synthase